MTDSLQPLQASWHARDLERELTELFASVYDDTLRARADDINVYGAPFLGSFDLVERVTEAEGLVVLRETTEARIRYLFKAWRYGNPERGLHFLRTYLRCLWGDGQQVEQLWQKKSEPYPTALLSLGEIQGRGESENDYYLTSRLRVDLDTTIVADRVIRSLRSAVAARFLIKVRIAKFGLRECSLAAASRGYVLCRTEGDLQSVSGISTKMASVFGAATVVYGQSD